MQTILQQRQGFLEASCPKLPGVMEKLQKTVLRAHTHPENLSTLHLNLPAKLRGQDNLVLLLSSVLLTRSFKLKERQLGRWDCVAVFNNACLPQAKGPLSLCHFHLLFPSSVTGCRGLGAVSTCQRTWSPHGSQSPSFCPGQSSLMPAHMPTGRGGHSKLGSPVLPFSAEYPRRGERTGGSHSRHWPRSISKVPHLVSGLC